MKKNKLSDEEKILNAMDALDKSTRNLQKFAAKYDEHIDRAAIKGDNKRVKQLIGQKIGVLSLADQLTTMKGNLELGAYTSKACADLGTLPAAIEGCKGLLAESPNFKKLGSGLQTIFKDMQAPVAELEKLNGTLNDILSPANSLSLDSRLDDSNDFTSNNEAFNAEYAAMMSRIKTQIAPTPVSPAMGAAQPVEQSTGEINFEGIISEENNRK